MNSLFAYQYQLEIEAHYQNVAHLIGTLLSKQFKFSNFQIIEDRDRFSVSFSHEGPVSKASHMEQRLLQLVYVHSVNVRKNTI